MIRAFTKLLCDSPGLLRGLQRLGSGFLELFCRNAMVVALRAAGLGVESRVAIGSWFQGELVGEFRAVLVPETVEILELEAARVIEDAFAAQTMDHSRATEIEVVLLLNV